MSVAIGSAAAKRSDLIRRYREASTKYAMPWLSDEVYQITAQIGIFNRDHSALAIEKSELL